MDFRKAIKKVHFRKVSSYFVWGIAATVLNVLVYSLALTQNIDFKIANLIALVLSKLFAYVTNKLFVFKSKTSNLKALAEEFLRFVVSRGFTGLIDYFGVIALVSLFHLSSMLSKYIIMGVVILLNYFFGSQYIYRSEGTMKNQYSSGNYEKYLSRNPLKKKMIHSFNEKLIRLVSKEAATYGTHASILDMGCGEGFLTELMQQALPLCTITGLDNNAEAIRVAKKSTHINYDVCSIYDLDHYNVNNKFDILVCTEVLEHLTSPEIALKKLMSKTSGTLILSVPNEPFFCMGNLLALKNVMRLGNPPDHINHWTFKAFLKWLNKNNIVIDEALLSFPWSIAVIRRKNNRSTEAK